MNEIDKIVSKLNKREIYEEYALSYSREPEGSIAANKFGRYVINFNTDDSEIDSDALVVCNMIDKMIPAEYGFELAIDNSKYSLRLVISDGLNGAANLNIDIDGVKSVEQHLSEIDWLAYQTEALNRFQDMQEYQESLNELRPIFPPTTELRKDLNYLAKKWKLKAKKKEIVFSYFAVNPRDSLPLEGHMKEQIQQGDYGDIESLYGSIVDSLGCGLHPIWIKSNGRVLKADATDKLKKKLIERLRDGSISRGNAELKDIAEMGSNLNYIE